MQRIQSGLKQLIEDTWVQLLALTSNEKIKVELSPSLSEDICSVKGTADGGKELRRKDPNCRLSIQVWELPKKGITKKGNCSDMEKLHNMMGVTKKEILIM